MGGASTSRRIRLFETLELGKVVLPNRIMLSPMCQYCAPDSIPGQWHKIHLVSRWPGSSESQTADDEEQDDEELRDPFHIELPTLVIANKIDLSEAAEDVNVLQELLDVDYPILAMSAQTLQGADELGDFLFRGLDVVRVYTKSPGKTAETEKPFTLRKGQTVADVARLVHKDVANTLRYARLWGGGRFEGQQVGPQHEVMDGDVLELHSA